MHNIVINGITFKARESDGYFNATEMCKAGGKDLNDWLKLDSTKKLIKEVQLKIKKENDLKK